MALAHFRVLCRKNKIKDEKRDMRRPRGDIKTRSLTILVTCAYVYVLVTEVESDRKSDVNYNIHGTVVCTSSLIL